jgi:NADPH-dependent glutamate synthase beta subunit-like oxidoreductase
VVVGGGNAAIDSARTALRLGAGKVVLLYRRGREQMPAIRGEVADAVMEGVEMQFLVAPTAIEPGPDGRCVVKCSRMTLGDADAGGRRRPVPIPGSETTVQADHVIVAIGQGPELEFFANNTGDDTLAMVSDKWIQTHPVTQRSGHGDVFAGGDVVTGPATIVEAVAAGQRAAAAIDVFLGGKGELPPDTGFAPRSKPDEDDADAPRQPVRQVPQARRAGSFVEVLKGYSPRAARCEARRCLRCDLE